MPARSIVKYWLPPLIWIAVIFLASGDLMSAEHTSRFLVPFLRWLWPDIAAGTLAEIHFCVRKAAHVTEYGILAFLVCRAIFQGANFRAARSILFVGAWVTCTLVAASDEFRQSFVESRGSSPWDVMIDSAGAILGSLLYARFGQRKTATPLRAPKSGFRNLT